MKILIYDDDLEELTQLSELLESLLSKRHIFKQMCRVFPLSRIFIIIWLRRSLM